MSDSKELKGYGIFRVQILGFVLISDQIFESVLKDLVILMGKIITSVLKYDLSGHFKIVILVHDKYVSIWANLYKNWRTCCSLPSFQFCGDSIESFWPGSQVSGKHRQGNGFLLARLCTTLGMLQNIYPSGSENDSQNSHTAWRSRGVKNTAN